MFLCDDYFTKCKYLIQLTTGLPQGCTEPEVGLVILQSTRKEIRTKKTAAAVLYLSPTRFKSVDIPATLALPEMSHRTYESMIRHSNLRRYLPIFERSLKKKGTNKTRAGQASTTTHRNERRYNRQTRGKRCWSSFRSSLARSIGLSSMASVVPSTTATRCFSSLTRSVSILSLVDGGISVCDAGNARRAKEKKNLALDAPPSRYGRK